MRFNSKKIALFMLPISFYGVSVQCMDSEASLVPSLTELASAVVAKQLREKIDASNIDTLLTESEKVLDICRKVDSHGCGACVARYMGNYHPASSQLFDKSIVHGLLMYRRYKKPEIRPESGKLEIGQAPFLITHHVDLSSNPVASHIIFWNILSEGGACQVGRADVVGTIFKAFAVNVEGTQLVTGSDRGELFLWNIADLSDPKPTGQFDGHPIAPITALCFARDMNGKEVVVSTAGDQTTKVWSVTGAFNQSSIYGCKSRSFGVVKALVWIPERYVLVWASNSGEIKMWDMTDSAVIIPIEGTSVLKHATGITALKVNPDNTMLLSGSEDGVIKLWDITDLKRASCITAFQGHKDSINEIMLCTDSHLIISVFSDKSMEMWDISNPVRPQRGRASIASLSDCINSMVGFNNTRIGSLMPYEGGLLSLIGDKLEHWHMITVNYAICLRAIECVAKDAWWIPWFDRGKFLAKLKTVADTLSEPEKKLFRVQYQESLKN